eukprot:4272564-Karenia_brevis.AAC.1
MQAPVKPVRRIGNCCDPCTDSRSKQIVSHHQNLCHTYQVLENQSTGLGAPSSLVPVHQYGLLPPHYG